MNYIYFQSNVWDSHRMTPITEVEGRRLALSNLEKVLYPATGFTKGAVLHYYATTAEVLLPHLRDRPVSFLRYPDGPEGQVFFTKNIPPGTPEWVTTAEVPAVLDRLEKAVAAGELSMPQVDASVLRMAAVKGPHQRC